LELFFYREDLKEALETPISETIWSIIAWLLVKMDELKERAYLAQFLVKIPIPEEMLLEEEVSACFDQVFKSSSTN
jgi:intraflagellar transport protein 81